MSSFLNTLLNKLKMLFDKINYLIFQIIILIVLLSACESSGNRNELTRQKLFTSQVSIEKPIPNRYFMPFGAHYNTLHKFSGAILIPEHSMISDPKEILPIDIQGKKTQLFPITFKVSSNGSNLYIFVNADSVHFSNIFISRKY